MWRYDRDVDGTGRNHPAIRCLSDVLARTEKESDQAWTIQKKYLRRRDSEKPTKRIRKLWLRIYSDLQLPE